MADTHQSLRESIRLAELLMDDSDEEEEGHSVLPPGSTLVSLTMAGEGTEEAQYGAADDLGLHSLPPPPEVAKGVTPLQ